MNLNTSRSIGIIIIVALAVVVTALLLTAPKNPQAILRVVDAAGKPIEGAVIKPQGLRIKTSAYSSGWWGWTEERHHVPTQPVTTDKQGFATLPYPYYVTEKLETGTLCLAVTHSNYVPARPESVVSTSLPRGAPWRLRFQDLYDRIRHHTLETRPAPIVLQLGATVQVTITNPPPKGTGVFFQQIFGSDENWNEPQYGVLISHQVSEGQHYARVVYLHTNGAVLYTDIKPFKTVKNESEKLILGLHPGATIHGNLDEKVPRPIKHGRVILNIWPVGIKPGDSPPQWHAWTNLNENGTFSIPTLPDGDLEIIALCDGFINTNGPGKFNFRYPQKHHLGTNDISITIGMEPTATLEVTLHDQAGHPVTNALVSTWPNVHWGEWGAVIFGADCYNTSDQKLAPKTLMHWWERRQQDFQGTSDKNGNAILSNLPPTTDTLIAENDRFTLPIWKTTSGEKTRQVALKLTTSETNHLSLQMVPKEQSVITHY